MSGYRGVAARQFIALLALVCLAACRGGGDDPRAAFTDSVIPPGLQARFYPPDGWAWGLIQPGEAPAARYGVSAPGRRPRADVLILTGYGEPAEAWFETARDLNDEGYVAWVLEPVGQGGSARYVLPRDEGDASGFAPDVEAAKTIAGQVVHRRPLVVLASREAAPAALAAFRAGLPSEGLILSAPTFSPSENSGGWRREGPDDCARGLTRDEKRGALTLAWQTANPDLRMGAPNHRWKTAFATAAADSLTDARSITAPVLVLQPSANGAQATALCRRLAHCTLQSFGTAGPALELETDDIRTAWLKAVTAAIEADISGFKLPPPQARLAPEG